MIQNNQRGAVSGLGISLGLTIFLLLGAIAFGGWAFSGRQDYKINSDAKVEKAVIIAKQQESSAKDAQFVQDQKKPLTSYNGPEAFGSLSISYPKTWSGYVDDSGTGTNQVDGYFNPGVVPSLTNLSSVFALRVQVVNQTYDTIAKTIANLQQSGGQSAPPVVSPYALPKLPKVVGMKIVGTLPNQKQGEMVILPLRAQTIQIWEETDQFRGDFENNILPNFSFIP